MGKTEGFTVPYGLSAQIEFIGEADGLTAAVAYLAAIERYEMTGEEPEEGYYVNPETAEMAQKIFENRDLRLLFDAAEDASPATDAASRTPARTAPRP